MRNRSLKISITPDVDDDALDKEATKTAGKFKKSMEGVGKVFGKLGSGAKAVGNAGHKALTGMQAGLGLLNAYVSKLGEIRGLTEELAGKFSNNVDLANSLDAPIENLRQLHLAYKELGVGEDIVNASLEKFQQLVASGEINVEGGDLVGGFLNFMDALERMSETERNEWLSKMGGKNITTNRKIMGANSQIRQSLINVRDRDRELIENEATAGNALGGSMDKIATMQLRHEMQALAQLYASGAAEDIIAAEEMILELAQRKLDGYDGRKGAVTSMKFSEDQKFIIEGAGQALGQSFFGVVEKLMNAEYATGAKGFMKQGEQFMENVKVALGAITTGMQPITEHLGRSAELIQEFAEAQKMIYADQKNRDEV